ncbi:hypothetical protein [Desulfosporosinus shakirovi]|uniref:hypothetical protein n=1 Tax=Desulfosporosinus shakirovi TaxID=2885154 RepID=UPI001E4355D8|nr:hypothetical protein [Desulfosporosinus sp. SRJS8]MCB8816137.1 hypothetical protein [Desulfosporosinus sp. SRJS8]
MQTTANLGLKKPEGTDVVNIQDFNDNADLLDNYAAATATLIGTKAPIASPALTGTPTAPTAGIDTSTTQVATTAFVLGQAGTTAPVMNGTAGIGSSKRYARADHVHPADTSRAGQADLMAHLAEDANPHGVTAAQVGAIPTSQKGVANGVATLGSDGKLNSNQRILPLFEPGNMILFSSDRRGQVNDDVWKECVRIKMNYSGTFRITFEVITTTSGENAYGRIYKNYSPFGTQRISTSTSGTAFTEDLAFNAGDTLSIYGKTDEAGVPFMRTQYYTIRAKEYAVQQEVL